MGNGNQSYPPALPSGSGNGNDWGQSFSGTFPPFPERGNSSGSLVALTTRNGNGQFGLNNQPDFASQSGFNAQPFGNSSNFGGQSPSPFGNPGNFESQPGFGGQSPSPFGSNSGGFESQPGLVGNRQRPLGTLGILRANRDSVGNHHLPLGTLGVLRVSRDSVGNRQRPLGS